MKTTPKIVPKPLILVFFVLGLLSSIAFRAIILLQKFSPAWVRPVWYFGVIGYLLFFMYRYKISCRRKATIVRSEIVRKLRSAVPLSDEDREAMFYLVNSIRKSPEDWNYLAIFIMSVVAMLLDWLIRGK
jgi:hypothetical protein